MCFSASASFVTSATLGIVGVATITKSKTWAELPLASMPLIFSIQQFIEGLLWIANPNSLVHTAATYGYISFAYVIWPAVWPWAAFLVEPKFLRKKLLFLAATLGTIVGIYFLIFLLKGAATATVLGSGILYDFKVPYLNTLHGLYAVAAIAAGIFSSKRFILIFGLALATALVATIVVFNTTYVSVWCFFAALLSLIIFMHFVSESKKTREGAHLDRIIN